MPSIIISVKPYIREFIVSRMNENASASLKNFLGAIIIPFLERMPRGAMPTIGCGEDKIEIDVKYLDIKFNLNVRGNVYISARNQENIGRILEAYFNDLLFQYVDDKRRYDLLIDGRRFNKGQLKKIILQFCFDNSIPFNAMNYETLKKKYYRKEKKREPRNETDEKSKLYFLV